MTNNEKINAKLNTANTLMNLYEQWFLSGNVSALAHLHNLVVKPVLKDLVDLSDSFDYEQKLDFEFEMYRSMLCCRLYGNMDIASRLVARSAAVGDEHFASLILNRRERSILEMADEAMSLEDELSEQDPESFARLLRVMHYVLDKVYRSVREQLESFEKYRAELEDSEECSVDEDAVAEFEDFAAEAPDTLAMLQEWLDMHRDVDMGDEFIKREESEDEEEDSDGGMRIGVGILGGSGLDSLFEVLSDIFGANDDSGTDDSGDDSDPSK